MKYLSFVKTIFYLFIIAEDPRLLQVSNEFGSTSLGPSADIDTYFHADGWRSVITELCVHPSRTVQNHNMTKKVIFLN